MQKGQLVLLGKTAPRIVSWAVGEGGVDGVDGHSWLKPCFVGGPGDSEVKITEGHGLGVKKGCASV